MKFEFCLRDDSGEIVASDWTSFAPTDIDESGAVETIDMHTGSALRFVRRQHLAGKLEQEMA